MSTPSSAMLAGWIGRTGLSSAEFADALKGWRAEYGFTQREAAAAIGAGSETV